MKIQSLGTELFHADGQIDRQTHNELIVVFHNSAKAPKTVSVAVLNAVLPITVV